MLCYSEENVKKVLENVKRKYKANGQYCFDKDKSLEENLNSFEEIFVESYIRNDIAMEVLDDIMDGLNKVELVEVQNECSDKSMNKFKNYKFLNCGIFSFVKKNFKQKNGGD